ncbi:MAG: hypothetical protein MUF53_01925 [Gemmatimonadaceae bacterium]|nr:hypothetical protein [Gemmatimonadaceae bacterium]
MTATRPDAVPMPMPMLGDAKTLERELGGGMSRVDFATEVVRETGQRRRPTGAAHCPIFGHQAAPSRPSSTRTDATAVVGGHIGPSAAKYVRVMRTPRLSDGRPARIVAVRAREHARARA